MSSFSKGVVHVILLTSRKQVKGITASWHIAGVQYAISSIYGVNDTGQKSYQPMSRYLASIYADTPVPSVVDLSRPYPTLVYRWAGYSSPQPIRMGTGD